MAFTLKTACAVAAALAAMTSLCLTDAALLSDPGHHVRRSLPRALRRRLQRKRSKLLDPPRGFGACESSSGGDQGALRVSPQQFGGDPTGRVDSTKAVHQALQVRAEGRVRANEHVRRQRRNACS